MYKGPYLLSRALECVTSQCTKGEDSHPILTQNSPILAMCAGTTLVLCNR